MPIRPKYLASDQFQPKVKPEGGLTCFSDHLIFANLVFYIYFKCKSISMLLKYTNVIKTRFFGEGEKNPLVHMNCFSCCRESFEKVNFELRNVSS